MRPLLALLPLSLLACSGPDATGLLGVEANDVDEVQGVESELTSSSRAQRWFPMDEGNVWVFEGEKAGRVVRLSAVGDGMARLSGLFPDDLWVGVGSARNTLLAWAPQTGRWVPFLRFGYARTPWSFGEETCTGLTLRRAATGVAVGTSAGSFTDTRVIALQQVLDPATLCAPPALTEIAFAAEVGPVALRSGRGERFTLKQALVAGEAVPGAVKSEVVVAQQALISTPNTVACVTTPCPSNAVTATLALSFAVTNASATAASWTFPTVCQFDVDLISATGRVVRRLSEKRACDQALSTLSLGPGEARLFTETVDLVDREGLQLDGEFTARATLHRAVGVLVPAATAPFSVRLVAP